MAYPARISEARRAPRREAEVDVLLEPEHVQLQGKTVNVSQTGALLQMQGTLRVVVEMNERMYTATLVRAFQGDDGKFQCAITFDGLAPEVDWLG